MAESPLTVPRFYTHTILNDAKSTAAGRPIYDEMEVVEIRTAANRQTVAVFPAHEVWKIEKRPDGTSEPITYAMRFPDQYRQFKAQTAQTLAGTPLEELPFLTAGKRLELKALGVHTGEALAALDGVPLKSLGMGGRELKMKAQAYIDSANGTADITKLVSDNASLVEQVAEMARQIAEMQKAANSEAAARPESPFESWSNDDLKDHIKEKTGATPRGNPSHATLVRMADELATDQQAA